MSATSQVAFSPNSVVQMSEGRTWSREDTQPYSFRLLLDCLNYLLTALMNVAGLEAECITFVPEGLLLAHWNCEIRVKQRKRKIFATPRV